MIATSRSGRSIVSGTESVEHPGGRAGVTLSGVLAAVLGFGTMVFSRGAEAKSAGCAAWTQSRCDAQNSASIELDAPKSKPPRAWSFDGSGRVWGYEPGMTTWSPPALAVVEGRAVVAAGSYDRLVYALDAATGELVWKFATGGAVASAPVFWEADGKVWCFVTSSDRLIYALDGAFGRQLWVHSVEDYRPTLGGARLASPTLGVSKDEEPVVFVPYWVWDRSVSNNEQRAGVIALLARTGRPLWNRSIGDNELTAAVFATVDRKRLLFLGSSNGTVLALDAKDGSELWRQKELDSVRSQPAFAETSAGPLVIMASKYGTVRGLSATTGSELWQWKTGDRITGSPAVLGAGEGARVFVGSYDRTLACLDAATGAVVWRYTARAGVYSSPAVVSQGARPMVIVSAWDHLLHAVHLHSGKALFTTFTGRPLWDVSGLDESNWSSPVAALLNGSWMAYAGSYDGTLRALPLEDADRMAPQLRSNLWFWLSFPLSLVPVGVFALYLTRQSRKRSGVPGPTGSGCAHSPPPATSRANG